MILQSSLSLAALATVAHSRLIITNMCMHDIYVWSVPNNAGYASNKAIGAGGGSYTETFHLGTPENPGIAVKISPEPNGIYIGAPQAQIGYTLDDKNMSTLWVRFENLDEAWKTNFTFNTCAGAFTQNNVPTTWCDVNTNVELVVCGSGRTTALLDSTPLTTLAACAKPHSDERSISQMNPRLLRSCHGSIVSPKPAAAHADGEADKHKDAVKHDADKHDAADKSKDASSKTRLSKSPAELKEILDGMKENCKCWITDDKEIKCDDECKSLVRTQKDGKYQCLTAGEFEFCLERKVLKRVVDANTFADKFAAPLLAEIYDDACAIAERKQWDCATFKAAIKAAYPDLDRQVKARGEPDKAAADLVNKHKQDADYFKACNELKVIMAGETNETKIPDILKYLSKKYSAVGTNIPLGYLIRKAYPNRHDRPKASDMRDEFENIWPDFDWSDRNIRPHA